MNIQEALDACTVEGFKIKPPTQELDKKVYGDLKTRLSKIGGVWKGGKIWAFVFEQDPTSLLAELQTGKKINLQQEYQFFETPSKIADMLVDLADINEGDTALEPSAGRGAIVSAIFKKFPRSMNGPNDRPSVTVDVYELWDLNVKKLQERARAENWLNRLSVMGVDFLESTISNHLYDRIIANPPFKNNQDLKHIMHMYKWLKPGGRLVSVLSVHTSVAGKLDKTESSFMQLAEDTNATFIALPSGVFKESGTNVPTQIIVINKPK